MRYIVTNDSITPDPNLNYHVCVLNGEYRKINDSLAQELGVTVRALQTRMRKIVSGKKPPQHFFEPRDHSRTNKIVVNGKTYTGQDINALTGLNRSCARKRMQKYKEGKMSEEELFKKKKEYVTAKTVKPKCKKATKPLFKPKPPKKPKGTPLPSPMEQSLYKKDKKLAEKTRLKNIEYNRILRQTMKR